VKDIQQFERVCVCVCVCVLVCGIEMYVPVSTGARKANQCTSGQTDLSTGDVSGFEMHGFSTAATGHVLFLDESEETPTHLSSSFPLKAGN